MGWKGKTAIGLFAVHAVLLFLPPIPPDIKGSLWSYMLGYGAVILGAFEIAPRAGALARRWRASPPRRRVATGVGAAFGALFAGLALRLASPDVFVRWAREEGVFEPLTVFAYLLGGLALFCAASAVAGRERRHLRFLGAGFFLLVLEEIDYLGIAGGTIGRVNGVYVGAPHDLINLTLEGLLTPGIAAVLVAAFATATAALWWTGYLQPVRLARTVLSPSGLWFAGGATLLVVAQAEDAGVFFVFGLPRIEELLELTGAILLLAFALDVAGAAGEVRGPGAATVRSGAGTGSRAAADAPRPPDSGPTSRLR